MILTKGQGEMRSQIFFQNSFFTPDITGLNGGSFHLLYNTGPKMDNVGYLQVSGSIHINVSHKSSTWWENVLNITNFCGYEEQQQQQLAHTIHQGIFKKYSTTTLATAVCTSGNVKTFCTDCMASTRQVKYHKVIF